jgi:hypothetical protein
MLMRRLILLLGLVLCAAACNPQTIMPGDSIALAEAPSTSTAVYSGPVNSVDSLLLALQAANVDTSLEEGVTFNLLSVSGRLVTVGVQRLQVFEYANAESAQADAVHFSNDGAWFHRDDPPTLVNWIATPHLYRSDKLLVVYVGDDTQTLNVLEALLGSPFAGGANPYSVAMQVAP